MKQEFKLPFTMVDMAEHQNFIEKWYYKYSTCQDIARFDTLYQIYNEEEQPGSDAEQTLLKEFNNQRNAVLPELQSLYMNILHSSISSFKDDMKIMRIKQSVVTLLYTDAANYKSFFKVLIPTVNAPQIGQEIELDNGYYGLTLEEVLEEHHLYYDESTDENDDLDHNILEVFSVIPFNIA